MNLVDLFREITGTYQKFGWTLRCVLLSENAQYELTKSGFSIAENITVKSAQINALWFSRFSGGREAWELRLLSSAPFALIETFGMDVPETEREKTRATMLEKLQMNRQNFKV